MRVDCGESSVTCRCDPITGCGHLSAWHRVTERWITCCEVPGCDCSTMDVCNCVAGLNGEPAEDFAKELARMGIKV